MTDVVTTRLGCRTLQRQLLPIFNRLIASARGVKYRDLRKDKNELLLIHSGQLLYKRRANTGSGGTRALESPDGP